ncbi:MAG TPA: T9SS type A sorting domain-containing protein [Bacteroidia bacterium]|nr:T9SS type A sorting domain-containing protein [Bacteroidia bacterium]
MKANRLLLAFSGIAAAGIAVFATFEFNNESKALYTPSKEFSSVKTEDGEGAAGAALYRFNRMKNPSGQVDIVEMLAAREAANQAISAFRQGDPDQVATVNWTELGPDNVGGRTRALVIDPANSNHMFAGGVGGGLWESNDGANNWNRCVGYFNVPNVNINVVSIAYGDNNTIYVGTGEANFYAAFGNGAGGFIGGGMYRSTDNGLSWTPVTGTAPSSQSSGAAWSSINKIAVDPNDTNHIFAATNMGLKISTDFGATWVNATGITATASVKDVDVTGIGRVIASASGRPYLSTDNGATFTNVGTTAFGFTPASPLRTDISIAPSDPLYVYAFVASSSGALAGVYVSTDGASSWTQVCGAGNAQFDPFGSGTGGQGDYDNVVAVDPNNKMRAIFGGVELWQFELTTVSPPAGQWTRIALEFPNTPFNPWYVHSDKHCVAFHPTIPGTWFVGTDGGVFRTINDGDTYVAMNSGYNVMQCYSVAFDHTDLDRSRAMAGTQDNGTQFVDDLGNTPMSANSVGGGDGGQCEISFLNPNGVFSTVYYGDLSRSNNYGTSSAPFYDTRITSITSFGSPSFASFVTPIRLWESVNDTFSRDSALIVNSRTILNLTTIVSDTQLTYTGQLFVPTINATPAGTVVLDSVMFTIGTLTINSDITGDLTGPTVDTGWVYSSGAFFIRFTTPPAQNQILKAYFDAIYNAGTSFYVASNIQGKDLNHISTTTLMPRDTMKVQDVIQSRLAVGFTGNNGIWITRRPIDFSISPEWTKIGGTASTPSSFAGETSQMAWSPDGNKLYVGTSAGNLYRFDNIGNVTGVTNGDVDLAGVNCIVRCTRIGSFTQTITGVDVDPSDASRVLVSLGGYGLTTYIKLSNSADTASSISAAAFVDKTNNLDNIGGKPVYSVSFDKYAPGRVLAGTENGMFETTNINAATPSWVPAMNGLDNVAVDGIRQQRWDPWLVPNSGSFYIGTHGRGMWRDDSSWQAPTGISNPGQPISSSGSNTTTLNVFPNPVVDNSNVTFRLPKSGDALVHIYDLTGKLIYSRNYEQLASGINTVQFETALLTRGTYLILVSQGSRRIGTGKFLKMD